MKHLNDLTEFEKFQQEEGLMISVSIFSSQLSSLFDLLVECNMWRYKGGDILIGYAGHVNAGGEGIDTVKYFVSIGIYNS